MTLGLYKHNKPSASPFSCVFLPSFLPSSTQTTKQLKVDFKYLFPFVILCSLPTFVPLSFLVFITFFLFITSFLWIFSSFLRRHQFPFSIPSLMVQK
ncbi:hypothetical protein K457DRAFT_531499 [Linnemannia elongata AG-77]|uniref:Uncharacterized protein n=1 Tax=Linnemannia elongata AG-77 TaxID=1314771 RepID=A0A197JUJ0_9FUNG|nr:hypothetical protein K457DRAFT_531499 [Linnemannia elongata AG-77]